MAENQSAPQGEERGQKSKYLSQAEGGIVDDTEGYQSILDGSPEKGIFHIVGGYLDDDGKVHNEVQLRAMSGHEEDLLSNDNVPFFTRMTGVLSQCCERFGDFTDRQQIIKAIRGLPAGSRQHLLVCLRRTSHWRATKDIYDMKVECPKCQQDSDFRVNLGDLELYEMADPHKRIFEGKLPGSGFSYRWRVTAFEQDQILSAVIQNDMAQHEMFTWGILIRLEELNGMAVSVRPSEVIDPDKGKMLKQIARRLIEVRQVIKNLSVDDRQYLRDEFLENEPGIETEIDFECPNANCKKPFVGRLDLGQRSFFFPSAQRKRSNRRSFT